MKKQIIQVLWGIAQGQPQVQGEAVVYPNIREQLNAIKALMSIEGWEEEELPTRQSTPTEHPTMPAERPATPTKHSATPAGSPTTPAEYLLHRILLSKNKDPDEKNNFLSEEQAYQLTDEPMSQ